TSSENMIHEFQTGISCRQCEEGSELMRLLNGERRTITAGEQYYSGTAGNDGGLTGSKGRAVRCQFGVLFRLGFGQSCCSSDRNCDQEDHYPNHDDPGHPVSSFGSRQGYKERVLHSS